MKGTKRSCESVAGQKGTSLVELLAAMGVLSILIYALSAMLSVALASFRNGTDGSESSSGVRLILECMERDLSAHCSVRTVGTARLPPRSSPVQREFFENRFFLPFEVNRREGTGSLNKRSFANAAPEFSSLAFAREAGGNTTSAAGSTALVGYYVAYAKNDPIHPQSAAGMKLFRHFRPGGHPSAEGYADGILRFVSGQINDGWAENSMKEGLPLDGINPAAVRNGHFGNGEFPFLFSRRLVPVEDARKSKTDRVRSIVHPWPNGAISERLIAPPPDFHPSHGSTQNWSDLANPIHETVFPDDVVCERVVRFELTPYRRVELPNGRTRLISARELNRNVVGSQGDEWPALIAPDVIDLVIGTISEEIAASLTRYEDWIVDWAKADAGGLNPTEERIVRNCREKRMRLTLPKRIR